MCLRVRGVIWPERHRDYLSDTPLAFSAMTELQLEERLRIARSGLLSTADLNGNSHIVPIVFAVTTDRLVSAVDHKPKTTRELKRLSNIAANPQVSVLMDHYDEDWSQLWWVRVDGSARVLDGGREFEAALDALVDKYEQYKNHRPVGPVIEIAMDRVTGWSASR